VACILAALEWNQPAEMDYELLTPRPSDPDRCLRILRVWCLFPRKVVAVGVAS